MQKDPFGTPRSGFLLRFSWSPENWQIYESFPPRPRRRLLFVYPGRELTNARQKTAMLQPKRKRTPGNHKLTTRSCENSFVSCEATPTDPVRAVSSVDCLVHRRKGDCFVAGLLSFLLSFFDRSSTESSLTSAAASRLPLGIAGARGLSSVELLLRRNRFLFLLHNFRRSRATAEIRGENGLRRGTPSEFQKRRKKKKRKQKKKHQCRRSGKAAARPSGPKMAADAALSLSRPRSRQAGKTSFSLLSLSRYSLVVYYLTPFSSTAAGGSCFLFFLSFWFSGWRTFHPGQSMQCQEQSCVKVTRSTPLGRCCPARVLAHPARGGGGPNRLAVPGTRFPAG